MAQHTTFEAVHTIEPIYTGGSVGLSQDGQVLATCLGEEVLLSDLATGQKLARVEGDGESITTMSLTPSCSHLIVCSRSLSMRMFSLDRTSGDSISAQLIRTLKPHSSPVVTSKVDATGSLVATGAADGVVKIWDIRGGYTTHTLHGHSGVISALLFFKVRQKEGETLSENKKKRKRSSGPEPDASTSANDGAIADFRLASGDDDGKIRIWHLQKRRCIAILDSHVSVVRGLDFSDAEQYLVSGSRDRTIMLWDAATWKLDKTIPVLEEVEATGFVSTHTKLLYTGGQNGNLRLWWSDGSEATEEQEQGNESHAIVDVIFNVDHAVFLTIHADQNVLIHLLSSFTGKQGLKSAPLVVERRISGTHDDVIDLAYVGGQGKHLAVATNLEELKILSLENSPNAAATATEKSQYFGADVGLLQGHKDIIISIDVDWSGHWLATGAKDNSARLWRIDPTSNSYICYATFTGHAESLGAVSLPKQEPPKDSKARLQPLDFPPPFLLTGSQDHTVKRWDIQPSKGEQPAAQRAVYTRKAHDKDINALDVNSDSSLFLSASQDRTVKIWSLEEGEPIGVLRGHKRGVWSAKFSPRKTPAISGSNDSSGTRSSSSRGYVVTGSGDKSVKIWSISDFNCLRTFEGHTNSVLKVLWMNSGPDMDFRGRQNGDEENEEEAGDVDRKLHKIPLQVASAASDGLVKIWDVESGECACTLDNHTDRVWALALNPSLQSSKDVDDSKSHTLVSGSADSTITLWRDTTQQSTQLATMASNARIEQDQALQNYIRSHSYKRAILLALKLNHPGRLLALFTELTKKWPKQEGSLTGVQEIDDVLKSLTDHQLLKLLERIREWNSNARTSHVAQILLWTILKVHPAGTFSKLSQKQIATSINDTNEETGSLKERKAKPGDVKDILNALRVYTERHYKRMEEFVDESFLIEYTLREMDEITGVAQTSSLLTDSSMLATKVNGTHRNGQEHA